MLIAPLLRAAAEGGGMTAVVKWLDSGDTADREIKDILKATRDPLAASAWRAIRNMEPKARQNVTSTARTVLAGWWDRNVLGLARPDLTPSRLISGSGSLYLVASAHHQDRLRSIFGCLVSEMTRAVFQHRAETGRRLDPGLLVVLDEAAHIAPVRNLPELAATGAEPGLQLVSVFHDAAQIQSAYGGEAATVVSNHRARLYLPGIGDAETLIQLSKSLGDVDVTRHHTSDGPAGRTTTDTITQRPLMTADDLRRMPDGEALLVYGTRHPARIRLRPWYRDRQLRRLAKGRT